MKRLLILLATLSLAACNLDVPGPEPATSQPSDPAKETFVGFNPPIDISRMIKTETGSYFRDDKVGTGAEIVSSTGAINYRFVGFLKSGQVFVIQGESQTVVFANLVGGLRDALRGMRVGGERTIVIPSAVAYGPTGNPALGVPGNATVIFDVLLDGIP